MRLLPVYAVHAAGLSKSLAHVQPLLMVSNHDAHLLHVNTTPTTKLGQGHA